MARKAAIQRTRGHGKRTTHISAPARLNYIELYKSRIYMIKMNRQRFDKKRLIVKTDVRNKGF